MPCISRGGPKFAKVGNTERYFDDNRKLHFRLNPNTWTYEIVQNVPHPDYQTRFKEHDIALVKVKTPITFNDFVTPICLPQEDHTAGNLVAIGYGLTGPFEEVSESLLKVNLDYFTLEECEETYSGNKITKRGGIQLDRMICAAGKNTSGDTCSGDSGGPLQVSHPTISCMFTQVGITSFGSSFCGIAGVPAVYTKVFFYVTWIESVVWPYE